MGVVVFVGLLTHRASCMFRIGPREHLKIKNILLSDCTSSSSILLVSDGRAFPFVDFWQLSSCRPRGQKLRYRKGRHCCIRGKYVRAARVISGTWGKTAI